MLMGCLLFQVAWFHRNRPDIRRDCDDLCCVRASSRRLVIIETDLTYEGIATRSMWGVLERLKGIETDLTYEGIATCFAGHFS